MTPPQYTPNEEADGRRRLDLEAVLAYGASGHGGTLLLDMTHEDDLSFYYCLGLDKEIVDGHLLDRAFFGEDGSGRDASYRPSFATQLGDYLTADGVNKRIRVRLIAANLGRDWDRFPVTPKDAATVGLAGIRPLPGGTPMERAEAGEYNSFWWAQLKPRRTSTHWATNFWWRTQMAWRWLNQRPLAKVVKIGLAVTVATVAGWTGGSSLGLVPSQSLACSWRAVWP